MNTNNLKQARSKRGLTQKQVADKIGIGQSTYKNYECGTREPCGDKIVALADLFGVSTDYLLGRTPDSNTELDKLQSEFNMSDFEKEVVSYYLSLPQDFRKEFVSHINDFAHTFHKENEKRK